MGAIYIMFVPVPHLRKPTTKQAAYTRITDSKAFRGVAPESNAGLRFGSAALRRPDESTRLARLSAAGHSSDVAMRLNGY